MTNLGCSAAAKRRIQSDNRRRTAGWILRFAQNDRKNSAGRTPDKSDHGFIENALAVAALYERRSFPRTAVIDRRYNFSNHTTIRAWAGRPCHAGPPGPVARASRPWVQRKRVGVWVRPACRCATLRGGAAPPLSASFRSLAGFAHSGRRPPHGGPGRS